jgi:hypothetical protein
MLASTCTARSCGTVAAAGCEGCDVLPAALLLLLLPLLVVVEGSCCCWCGAAV